MRDKRWVNGAPQARRFLSAAYEQLDYTNGDLSPELRDVSLDDLGQEIDRDPWLRQSDALESALELGADRVFFVRDDPVVIFAASDDAEKADQLERSIMRLYRDVWSMTRPRCLFVALPTELRVYGLTQPPARSVSDWTQRSPLYVVRQ